jgi:hypothetical protein
MRMGVVMAKNAQTTNENQENAQLLGKMGDRLDSLRKAYNQLKWIFAAVMSVTVIIFLAGFYYRTGIYEYDRINLDISQLKNDIGATNNAIHGLETTVSQRFQKLGEGLDAFKSALGSDLKFTFGGVVSKLTKDVLDNNYNKITEVACPKGEYAAGISAWGNPGDACRDCFKGVELKCRPLISAAN